ncbi:MAG: pantetheine-phosphate adenylyltransferase [Candidatus Aenigmarchaeota archaeon]|nr:pantetheine-phosphate adenylyltransferase [Candidatus Aenigmarchaeota archaeon]
MTYKYKKVCFGGTFDIPIHRGHEALIKRAFEVGKFCLIGLTSDRYACSLQKIGFTMIRPYEEREKNLIEYLESKGYSDRYEIIKLDDFCDRRLLEEETDVEAIIVSEQRVWVAEEINKERGERGFKPFKIVQIPMVLAEDRVKISSGRIRAKEIDRNGKLLKSSKKGK